MPTLSSHGCEMDVFLLMPCRRIIVVPGNPTRHIKCAWNDCGGLDDDMRSIVSRRSAEGSVEPLLIRSSISDNCLTKLLLQTLIQRSSHSTHTCNPQRKQSHSWQCGCHLVNNLGHASNGQDSLAARRHLRPSSIPYLHCGWPHIHVT